MKGRSGGHNRKALEVHLLAGTYRPDRHGPLAAVGAQPVVPLAVAGSPPPPAGLSAASAAFWGRLVADFGGWTAADLALLALALEQLDRKTECRTRIARDGLLLTSTRGGTRPHPLLRVERDAGAAVLAIFRHLGLGAPR